MEFFTMAFSLLAIIGALGVIFFIHPLHSAISFLVVLLSIAGFYALLSSPTLFIMQIIIYAGAIMVLIMFVIMYLNLGDRGSLKESFLFNKSILAFLIISPFGYLLLKSSHKYIPTNATLPDGFGSIEFIGFNMFNNWYVTFELISVLLLGAVIGAILVAQKERNNG
jgi:NADH-quinone oxidoreductase subunit J